MRSDLAHDACVTTFGRPRSVRVARIIGLGEGNILTSVMSVGNYCSSEKVMWDEACRLR